MLPKRPDGREQSSLNWEYEFAVPLPKEGEEGVREGTVFRVKWCDFVPTYRGKPKEGLSRCIAANNIKRVTLMMRRLPSPCTPSRKASWLTCCSFFGMQQGDFEIEIKSIAAFKEGDEQVESPAPVRQDGEDMTEKLRQQQQEEQRGGRPPPSRERIEDAMVSKTSKEADEPKRPKRRGRPKNPILRLLSSCCAG
jgi:hypothetical protein